jgi:hypothetical protein
MHALIQTDAEMSEVLLKTLIYRRLELVAQGIGDALLIGSAHSAATLRIRAFLTHNGHPFKYLDLDRDSDVRELLDRFAVGPANLPVLICRGEAVLKNPSNQMIADRLGFNDRIDQAHLRDVVIVGAGPAGLAAASTQRPRVSTRANTGWLNGRVALDAKGCSVRQHQARGIGSGRRRDGRAIVQSDPVGPSFGCQPRPARSWPEIPVGNPR